MARNHQRSPFKVRYREDDFPDVMRWGVWFATFRSSIEARSFATAKNAEWRKERRKR